MKKTFNKLVTGFSQVTSIPKQIMQEIPSVKLGINLSINEDRKKDKPEKENDDDE